MKTLLALSALLVSLPGSPSDLLVLEPAIGTELRKQVDVRAELHLEELTLTLDGEPREVRPGPAQEHVYRLRSFRSVDRYLGTALLGNRGPRVTTLVRVVGEATRGDGPLGVDDADGRLSRSVTTPLSGRAVRLVRPEPGEPFLASWADADRVGESELLAGLDGDVDFGELLVHREVAPGDAWEVPAAALRAALLPGGDLHLDLPEDRYARLRAQHERELADALEGELSVRYEGLDDTSDAPRARLAVSGSVRASAATTSELTDEEDFFVQDVTLTSTWTWEVAGTVLWSLEGHHLDTLELAGEASVEELETSRLVTEDEADYFVEHRAVLAGTLATTARFESL